MSLMILENMLSAEYSSAFLHEGERACPVCDLEERICDEPIIQRGVAEDKTDCEVFFDDCND